MLVHSWKDCLVRLKSKQRFRCMIQTLRFCFAFPFQLPLLCKDRFISAGQEHVVSRRIWGTDCYNGSCSSQAHSPLVACVLPSHRMKSPSGNNTNKQTSYIGNTWFTDTGYDQNSQCRYPRHPQVSSRVTILSKSLFFVTQIFSKLLFHQGKS